MTLRDLAGLAALAVLIVIGLPTVLSYVSPQLAWMRQWLGATEMAFNTGVGFTLLAIAQILACAGPHDR